MEVGAAAVFSGNRHRRRARANGEINRELSLLRRAFNLGKRAGRVLQPPYVPMLKEDNVRTGFFEREQFQTVRRHLPEACSPSSTSPT